MFGLKANKHIFFGEEGLTLVEILISLVIMSISILGTYGILIAVQEQQSDKIDTIRMYDEARIALDRMYREISETSNRTVSAGTGCKGVSFASARNSNGVFQWETYGSLNFSRPVWKKAVIYYVYKKSPQEPNKLCLYRKTVNKTNWSGQNRHYNTCGAVGYNGEIVAEDVYDLTFYPTDVTAQNHYIQVNLEMKITPDEDEDEEAIQPGIKLSTVIPMMNRER
ncbi:prepilin-type N-terminal cleavage/methylation domain-containing protein [Candidatus Poribacteria bacterium]|nr:prepilin-type N-terminal cleavage/methylation domain-containing protein [Candidatus Poribacteria bacterium]